MKNFITLIAIPLFIVASLSGCKTMEFEGVNWFNQQERPRLRSPLKMGKKADEFGVPEKMAVIWKDSVYHKPGAPAARGFGGRFYFYDAENKPVKVTGEMVVYGFDQESGKHGADKKFVFKQDNLEEHYSETPLGHSYSFWVPWDKQGSPRTSVTLIPIFNSNGEKIVKGGQTVNVLPGPERTETASKRSGTYNGKEAEIKLTSGEMSAEQIASAGATVEDTHRGIRTTTIKLPKHLASRVTSIPDRNLINQVSTAQSQVDLGRSPIDLRTPSGEDSPQTERDPRSRYSPFKAVIQKARDAADQSRRDVQPQRVFGQPGSFGG